MQASRLNLVRRRVVGWLATMAFAATLTAGCGPNNGTVKVTGVAKLTNGRALPGGRVFLTGGPAGANGAIKSDGSFTLGTFTTTDGVKPGKYTVLVTGAAEPDTRTYEERIQGVGKEPPSLIAKKYANAATSDIKVEITNGPNVLDLSLEPSEAGAAEPPAKLP